MIGESQFHATARFENGAVAIKVTAVTPYGNRKVSVSEDLSAPTIDGNLERIRAQLARTPDEIAKIQKTLTKKLSDEEREEAERTLENLEKNLIRLPKEEAHQQKLKQLLAAAEPKLTALFQSVMGAIGDDLQKRAFKEAARAVTVALENEEAI